MNSVVGLNASQIFDLEMISNVFGSDKLHIRTRNSRELEVSEINSYQQGLEMSIAFLDRKGAFDPKGLPQKFFNMRGQPGFSKTLKNYVKNHFSIELPSKQVEFSVWDVYSEFEVAKVHLADIAYDRWALIDILLQKNILATPGNALKAEYEGLGGSVFDETLLRIEGIAKRSGVREICLMAYLEGHKNIFKKRGFQIIPSSDVSSDIVKLAEQLKMSYPMWKKI